MASLQKVVAVGVLAGASALHHETATFDAAEFKLVGRAKATEKVTFTAALPWQNFDKLEATLLEVSDPDSPQYGQWLTQAEVNTLTAPKAELRAEAKAALAAAGAKCVDLPHSLKCEAPVAAAEKLFSTKISAFEHTARGGRRVLRVAQEDAYEFPAALAGSVQFFTNLVDFPTVRRKLGHAAAFDAKGRALRGLQSAGDYSITPETIATFYGTAAGNNNQSTQAPAEFQDDASYNPTDLKNFAKEMGLPAWEISKRVGPFSPANPDLEATLDVQYIGSTSQGNSNWYWTETEWQYEFVEHLAATPDAGVPRVFSISWGWSEADQCTIDQAGPCSSGNDKGSAAYVTTTNQGFAAAGVRGISILVSSGDSGAHGRTDPTCSSPKTRPDWPTASPYILSVGATQVSGGKPIATPTSPFCKNPPSGTTQCAGEGTEIVASPATGALIASGGGFSNVAAQPAWQAAAVKAYLASNALLPPAKTDYNATSRGYPDVAAFGHNVPILAAGSWTPVDGTSCSTPIFAGFIADANAQRLTAGKKVLGFLPPAIYKIAASTPAAFTDVITGNNRCTENGCAASCTGYGAVAGWDAATGWGTPKVDALVKALVALP